MFSVGNWNDPEKMKYAQTWLTLFKDGFLLLGGALTTLIGYYFGTRGSEVIIDKAEKYKEEARKLELTAEESAPTINENEFGLNDFQDE